MFIKIILLSLLSFLDSHLPGNVADAHEFHMSKCQIEYNDAEQALQMTLHLFIDDLEEALRNNGADQLHLCSEKETAEAEQFLFQYLQKKFLIQVNQKSVEYAFIGKEQSEDLIGVWVYLEVTGIENLAEISVTNQLLLEVFEDQKNITSVSKPPRKQSYFIMDKSNTQESVKYP